MSRKNINIKDEFEECAKENLCQNGKFPVCQVMHENGYLCGRPIPIPHLLLIRFVDMFRWFYVCGDERCIKKACSNEHNKHLNPCHVQIEDVKGFARKMYDMEFEKYRVWYAENHEWKIRKQPLQYPQPVQYPDSFSGRCPAAITADRNSVDMVQNSTALVLYNGPFTPEPSSLPVDKCPEIYLKGDVRDHLWRSARTGITSLCKCGHPCDPIANSFRFCKHEEHFLHGDCLQVYLAECQYVCPYRLDRARNHNLLGA